MAAEAVAAPPLVQTRALRVPVALDRHGAPRLARTTERCDEPFECPDCGGECCLRKGTQRQPHFAHKCATKEGHVSDCAGGEGAVHNACKLFICDNIGSIDFVGRCPGCRFETRWRGTRAVCEKSVSVESRCYRLDLQAHNDVDSTQAAIEVLSTHRCHGDKLADLHSKFGENVFEVKAFDYEDSESALPLTLDRVNCPLCKACVARRKKLEEERRRRAEEERWQAERQREAHRLAWERSEAQRRVEEQKRVQAQKAEAERIAQEQAAAAKRHEQKQAQIAEAERAAHLARAKLKSKADAKERAREKRRQKARGKRGLRPAQVIVGEQAEEKLRAFSARLEQANHYWHSHEVQDSVPVRFGEDGDAWDVASTYTSLTTISEIAATIKQHVRYPCVVRPLGKGGRTINEHCRYDLGRHLIAYFAVTPLEGADAPPPDSPLEHHGSFNDTV